MGLCWGQYRRSLHGPPIQFCDGGYLLGLGGDERVQLRKKTVDNLAFSGDETGGPPVFSLLASDLPYTICGKAGGANP